ncbi:MAG: hypothetical protein B7Y43_18750 [Sphingomonas sp. 28-62-20]|uniref:hypothetical protein n=1 Tax=Sphingomonas sp. 28-62-20 TaxID=1970433 RepID=UPI000BC70139|nr:MAG: hypothetical protein B7Y43_18750 [Sphingomonas sp. 28-62-20]
MSERRQTRDYETSLDRAGLAIGAGGIIGGVIEAGLTIIGGTTSPLGILVALLLGSVLTALAITAIAAPVWVFLHASGRRGPGHALAMGGAIGFLLFLFAQTYGFGLLSAPPSDAGTLLYRWASAAATSALLATLAAGIALAMWRVAYRPRR